MIEYSYDPPYNLWSGNRSDTLNKWKINYKGSIATASALPEKGDFKGDTYNVLEDGSNYMWNGKSWDKLDANVYVGATSTKDGIQGLVPPAEDSERNKFFKGDATWDDVAWSMIVGKPLVYPPDTHTHVWNDITDKPKQVPSVLYVDASNGNDENFGDTPQTAKKTINSVLTLINNQNNSNIADSSIYYIYLASGTYDEVCYGVKGKQIWYIGEQGTIINGGVYVNDSLESIGLRGNLTFKSKVYLQHGAQLILGTANETLTITFDATTLSSAFELSGRSYVYSPWAVTALNINFLNPTTITNGVIYLSNLSEFTSNTSITWDGTVTGEKYKVSKRSYLAIGQTNIPGTGGTVDSTSILL